MDFSESTAISPPFSTNAILAGLKLGISSAFMAPNMRSANAPATAAIGPTSHSSVALAIKLIIVNFVFTFTGENDFKKRLSFNTYFSNIFR